MRTLINNVKYLAKLFCLLVLLSTDAIAVWTQHADFRNDRKEHTYNAEGNIETQRDRNGHVTRFVYDDNNGNLRRVIDPEGGVTEHTYYANGDRATTKDPEGNITRFKYDQYGNVSEVIDAKGNVTTTGTIGVR